MKKILFVTNTMGRAGAERTLIALLDILDKERYDISLLAIIPRGEFFSSVPKDVKILNKKYADVSVMSKSNVMSNFFIVIKSLLKNLYFFRFIPYAFRNLFGQFKMGRFSFDKLFWNPLAMYAPVPDEEYDLAIAYLEGAATYYVSERVKAKKKVSFLHIDYTMSGYVPHLDKPYYEKMDKVFCVSESVKESFTKIFPRFENKVDLFQNTISDAFIIQGAERGVGFTDGFDGIRLLTIGRLHYQKAFDIAIPAFARIHKETGLNIRWYVIGEGLERSRLEKMIVKYNLEGKFILMGGVSNPYPYLKQCDIYIHATRYEGWCIAIAEAKILKKPIIASDTAGTKEQISPESSVIIHLSEDELVRSIIKLATDPEKRAAISKRLEEKWERPNDASKLYALLENSE